MLKYLLILFFLAANFHSVIAQQPFLLPSEAKKINVKNFIKEGFYLLHDGNIPNNKTYSGVQIIKSYNRNTHIIFASSASGLNFLKEEALYEISPAWKLAPSIKNLNPITQVLLSISTLDPNEFRNNPEGEILQQHNNSFIVKASPKEYSRILNSNLVTYISLYRAPTVETPVNQHDLTVNSINYVHHLYPGIRGNELKVSIKEFLFDTTDVDFQNRYDLNGLQADNIDRHATLIATLIMGAGNSNNSGRGVAPAAVAGSSSFLRLFPDQNSYFTDNGFFVQNHSYGTGIETLYGNEAAAYDKNVSEIPGLVHVFSAGNKGLEAPDSGRYVGIPGVANMTGNFKMAKNVITVGAVNREKIIEPRSSKGPTNDGRLKPELVAYAPEGTSDAAALVSGTALLLQELYQEKEGNLPESSLIKAVFFAGAEDVGEKSIDFSSGYGNLNAGKSMEILEAGNYLNGEISENEQKEFRIIIPEGTATLKVALAWIDPAANPGDEIVLVNDLDLQIKDPAGNLWHPWVLNNVPGNLDSPAQRGRDNLNPAELVTIENPIAGEYVFQITSEEIEGDFQKFAIAYSRVAENKFFWTFPTSDDAVNTSESINMLRWKNSFVAGTGKLEYNINNEGWNTLAEDVDLEKGFFEWNALEETGRAQLRMKIGTTEFLSDFFAVSPELVPEVLYNCEEEVMLSWEKVENATSYQLQNLGTYYMQDFLEVEDTTAVLNKENFSSDIWTVIPIFNNSRGPSGFSINYKEQGVSCYYQNFFALLDEGPVVSATLNLSTTAGIEKIIFRRNSGGAISIIEEFTAPINSFQFSITDTSPETGTNIFYASIILENGREINTNEINIFVPGENTLEVFPNPVKAGEDLTVISKGDDLEIQIFDMQGRMLSQNDLIRFTDRFQIKFYTPGMYIIRTSRRGKQVGTAKILVY